MQLFSNECGVGILILDDMDSAPNIHHVLGYMLKKRVDNADRTKTRLLLTRCATSRDHLQAKWISDNLY